MHKYKRVYLKYHGLTEADWIGCAVCGATSVDLHHINGRLGGLLYDPTKLIPLCRECHNKAHANILTKQFLLNILDNQNI